jgi:hypothetical protein
MLLHPRGVCCPELVQGLRPGFPYAFEAVERAGCREDRRRSGALRTPPLDPALGFAGDKQGIEEPLGGLMDEQTCSKIGQQGEVKTRVGQLQAHRLLPIHAAPDRIGRLALGEPCDIVPHQHERQAPGRDFHGTPGGRIPIGKELIVITRAALGTELPREVAFGKGGLHGGRRRRGHWGEGVRA